MGTPYVFFSAIFTKGDKLYGFLFASLESVTLISLPDLESDLDVYKNRETDLRLYNID